ncbi:uncharacterized protein LOC132935139 [Metopolophium dirhodum]|uniref:uncharacterized protein LOC132935139 n=1 Tax=Metopolophium dirhodum TaxID=44670 RepID=UPI0029902248|nr:uncharacterized protein LOC132935139 [Metopolophium dirhodum]
MSESDSSDIDTSSADSSIKVENYKSRKELKEAVLKDAVKKEFLEQTRKHIVKTEKTVRKNLVRTHSLTEQIGTTPRKQTVGRLGTRSDSSVIHMQLESVVKKKTSKMDLDKAIAMIPICTGKKDVAEFINICEIAIKETTEADTPILLKIITSKLTGNALEVTKYRNLETWGAIKTILEGAFEQKVSERALSIALNTARMAEGESVAKFASRIEELYYKLCAASTVGLAQAEADIVKKQTKKQAMIIFMTGLPHHLYTVLKSRNPSTLEQCFKTAIDEMLEYESKVEMDKLQRQIGNGNRQTSITRKNDKMVVIQITQLIAEETVIQIKAIEIIISTGITTDMLITTTAITMGIIIRADMAHTWLIAAVIEAETAMDGISMAIMYNKIILTEAPDATLVVDLIT